MPRPAKAEHLSHLEIPPADAGAAPSEVLVGSQSGEKCSRISKGGLISRDAGLIHISLTAHADSSFLLPASLFPAAEVEAAHLSGLTCVFLTAAALSSFFHTRSAFLWLNLDKETLFTLLAAQICQPTHEFIIHFA